MKFLITEIADYEVEADSAQDALKKFKKEIRCPFPTTVSDRWVALLSTGEECEVIDD